MRRLWYSIPRWARLVLRAACCLALSIALVAGAAWWYFHPSVKRRDGIIYGDRDGTPLTLDVIQPGSSNGRAIAFMASGGWKSASAGETPTWMLAPILRHGFTVFVVCHVSQPKATVMQIIKDTHRSIRYIRSNAREYDIDPNQIGVSGGSAGGHLSLMLATRGGPGDKSSKDPVDRASSSVQAVAIFYPPTDLVNMGDSTENPGEVGGPPTSFRESFGKDGISCWDVIGKDCSPIYHVNDQLPPTLIYHGDSVTLVPLDQSQRYQTRALELGNTLQLVVHPGGGHGWLSMLWDARHFAQWFEQHLK